MDGKAQRGVGMALGLEGLRRALGTGEPYREPLGIIAGLAEGDPELSAAVQQLEPRADQGVPSLAQLATDLEATAAQGTGPTAQGPDWLAAAQENIESLVSVREAGAPEDPARAAVEQAREALLLEDVPAAIAAVRPLADQGNAAAREWIAAAEARLAAEAAVDALAAQVQAFLTAQR